MNKNENTTFDCSIAHRKYFRYHDNLIGATHGDGAKQNDLPLLMAEESTEDWAKTKHRHIYTHRVHHKTSKDIGKVNIESIRSASGTDSWHDRNGYRSINRSKDSYITQLMVRSLGSVTFFDYIYKTLDLFKWGVFS